MHRCVETTWKCLSPYKHRRVYSVAVKVRPILHYKDEYRATQLN